MSYLNTTIRDLITEKIGRNTFLPAIQREYVWSPYQVEKLFDSLLCGYPISSFLFWRIREENKKDWISYEFIRDFDAASPHNIETNLDGVNQDIYLVLDGQQRITSLNIGLRGSYRFFYRRWRKTRLYLNLLWNHDNDNPEELTYQFLFKEDDQPLPRTNYAQYWYRVGDILNYEDAEDAKDAIENKLFGYSEEEQKRAKRMIGKLHSVVNVSKIINYYEEKSDDYDKVLEIFIRTNTGGQKLEYSDILLSTATAKWRNLNAREEINSFTDEINKIGIGYNFGKDFVMKGAMYLTEDLPIQYKLSSFTQSNLEKIEDHWDVTKEAIRNTVTLISRYGFNDKNLVTKLALLPIAQYLRNIGSKNYLSSSKVDDVIDQNNIQKWLIFIILKNGLGGSSDTKLTQMRKIVDLKYDTFPYAELNRELLIESSFNDMELDSILQTKYATRYSYLILSLLYPGRDWKDKTFHEDHIFPQTEFQRKKLKARGYDDDTIEKYQSCYNTILNLELLDESENKIKNAKPFEEWLADRDENFKTRHHIPQLDNYDFDHFLEFVEKRKEMLLDALRKIAFEE
jgi:uncharacterized protein with ParB-like and HNH nuclease domain